MQYVKRNFTQGAPPAMNEANLDAMDDAIADAHADQEYGTLAARPAASQAKANHIYWAYDTGERFLCDGTQWLPLTVGNGSLQDGAVSLAKLGAAVQARLIGSQFQTTFNDNTTYNFAPATQGFWLMGLYYGAALFYGALGLVGTSTGDGVSKICRTLVQGQVASHSPFQGATITGTNGTTFPVVVAGSTGGGINFRARCLTGSDVNGF